MVVYLLKVTFPNVSGIVADESVNDFVFNAPSTPEAAGVAVMAFYNAAHGGADPLAGNLGAELSRAASVASIDTYDITSHLDGSPHGSPLFTTMFTLGAAGVSTSLPAQVAMGLSYNADFGTTLEHGPTATRPSDHAAIREGAPATHTVKTRPKASLRGRLYLGPCISQVIDSEGNLSTPAKNTLNKSAKFLRDAALGWAVWSRVNHDVHNVVGGWVNDELTIQRRRRLHAPTKSSWT